MAKIDKTKYTKDQWKVIKHQRKIEKNLKSLYSATKDTEEKRYILCLKHGTKYSADYVNKLYNSVKRHCTLPFEMVCLTEDSSGIDKNIRILPLPENLTGWWCKPYMYSKDLPLNGTVLYLDLDVVIAGNIDKLFEYQPHKWCTIRDFTRAMRPKWNKYNSSVIRFKVGELDDVWQKYTVDPNKIIKRYFGDQDYLFDAVKHNQPLLFPDSWILSWKWEVRSSKTLLPGHKGTRKLQIIEDVVPPPDCCITVFHGDPNPHNCEDPWVVDNWK